MARPKQHVSDSAGAIDAAMARRLENILANLQRRTDINFVVVTIKTAGNKDLFDCSVDLANEWDIGSATSRQKSLLMLIAGDNGKFYTQTSPAAQNLVPGLVGYMGRRMHPQFQAGNYGEGLLTGIQTFVSILGERLNFSFEALDRQSSQPLPAASARSAQTTLVQPVEYRPVPISRSPEAIPSYTRPADEKDSSGAGPLASIESNAKAPPSERRVVERPVSTKAVAGRTPITLPAEKALPVRIPRFMTRPVIDGHLDDAIWKQAVVLKDFYQVQPGDNVAPSQPTEVLLGYDDKFLYVAFRAHDDPNKIRVTIAGRDRIFDDDTVGMVLDTFNDQRKAYQLFFNPLGVQADAVLTEGQDADSSVDVVMESIGTITTDGYVVEVAIPFKSLRYEAGEGKIWGVHFQRRIKRINDEVDSWMPISRDRSSYLSQEGHLTGLVGISQARTLEIIPTLTISERGKRVSDPVLPDATRLVNQPPSFQPGVTMKFGIRPNVIAALTINPDLLTSKPTARSLPPISAFRSFLKRSDRSFLKALKSFARRFRPFTRARSSTRTSLRN